MPDVSSGVSWTGERPVAYDFGSMPQSEESGEPVLVPRDDIKKAREILGVSQEVLAARAGVSHRTVARLEAGEPISLQTAQKIAPALGVSLSFITDPAAAPAAPPRLAWSEFLDRVKVLMGGREIAPEAVARLRFAYDEIVRPKDKADR